ncbi:MAG: helix-turn-helix transcriptional regulator [Fimbriimonadaceae bacterium]|nr:helix-turn-helix transcriptional regulator [Fimbriimonadaceae bacterium]
MSSIDRSVSVSARCHNRVAAIMVHTGRYSFLGTSRLARDAGVSTSAITRLLHGRSSPRYSTLAKVVKCLEVEIRKPLDVRDVFSPNGTYLTQYVCDLVGCPGCLPDRLYEPNGSRDRRYLHITSGRWTGDTGEFGGVWLKSQEDLGDRQ